MSSRQVTYTLSLKDQFSSKIKDATKHVLSLNRELAKTKGLLNVLGTFSSGAKSPMNKMAKSTSVATVKNNEFNASLARTERGLIRINGLIRSSSSYGGTRMLGGTSFSGGGRRTGAGMGYGGFADAMYAGSEVGRYRGSSIFRTGGGGGGGGSVPPFNPYAFAGYDGSGIPPSSKAKGGRKGGGRLPTNGRMGMGGIYTALASGYLVKSVVETTAAMQALENQFKFASGGAAQGADELKYIAEQSEYLGLNFEATAKSYAKLAAATKGTKLEKETRGIFKGIATASSVMHLTAEGTNRAMYALQQMVSKGRVSSEELNRQLGEILPGANKRAAEAMVLTTQELYRQMKAGKLYSEDFLPAFAARLQEFFVDGLRDSTMSLQANLSRMDNAWFRLKATLGTALLPTINKSLVVLGHFMNMIAKLPAFYRKNATAIDYFAKVLGRLIAIFITWKLILTVLTIKQWAHNAALAFGVILQKGWAGVALVAAAGLAVWGLKTWLASEAQEALNNETERGLKLAREQSKLVLPPGVQLLGKSKYDRLGAPAMGFPFKHNPDQIVEKEEYDLSSNITSVEARQPQNFNISIDSMIEKVDITQKNIKDSAADIKSELTRALVEAVNDFQIIAAK